MLRMIYKTREATVEWLRRQQRHSTARHIVTMFNGQQIKRGDMYGRAADLIETLAEDLERVERERDAAVADLHYTINHPIRAAGCYACKHQKNCPYMGDCDPVGNDRWEWRGVEGQT